MMCGHSLVAVSRGSVALVLIRNSTYVHNGATATGHWDSCSWVSKLIRNCPFPQKTEKSTRTTKLSIVNEIQ